MDLRKKMLSNGTLLPSTATEVRCSARTGHSNNSIKFASTDRKAYMNIMTKLFSLVALCLLLLGCSSSPPPLPNILFIMMDDLGYGQTAFNNDSLQVQAFDPYFMQLVAEHQGYSPEEALAFSKTAMPTLSNLADKGVKFTNAYAPSSLCAPSRLAIATAMYNWQRGIYINLDVEQSGIEPGTHLAEVFQEMGYATAHIGKWHIGVRDEKLVYDALKKHKISDTLTYRQLRGAKPEVYRELLQAGYYGSVIREQNPLNNGFDYYYGYNNWASQFYNSTLVWEDFEHAGLQKEYNTNTFTDKALEFIRQRVKGEQPFLVQLHYHAVHDSLEPKAPEAFFSKFPSDSYDLTNFYAHVYGVDYNVRRIVDYLKSVDQYENTIIVFTSDNGAQAGGPSVLPGNAPYSGTKGTYYQGGVRVPFFVHWPAKLKQPFTSDALASTMDIYPTLIEAVNGRQPEKLDGKSLLPMLLRKDAAPVHTSLQWAGMHSRAWGFLINKSFKGRGEERSYAPPSQLIIKKDHLFRFVGTVPPNIYKDHPDGKTAEFEIYDLRRDPAETENLFGKNDALLDEFISISSAQIKELQRPVVWDSKRWQQLTSINLMR